MNFRELFQSTAFKVTATIVLALALQGALLVGFMSWSVFRFADGRAERFRETALADRKEALRDKVQLAYTVVESAYNRSRDLEGLKRDKEQELKRMVEAVVGQAEYLLKTRDRAAAEEDIKRLVTGLRFDGGNYVWINDLTPAMVLHPVRPDLNGKDLKDFKDPRGKALFVDMVRAVREGNGAGLVDYLWAKPGETEPKLKISYVRLLPALGWIFGSGAWVEDITARMQAQALAEVGRMRLADGNYFWINDSTLPVPRMVMHPTVPALDGKLLDDPKFDCATVQQAGAHGAPEDVGGHKNLFTAAAEVATQAGEGYVTYLWPKPKGSGTTAERYPKLSYVKLFKPWGWVLGMGAYVDEIDAQTAAQKAEMRESVRGTVAGSALFGLLFLVLFGLLAALLIRREIGRPLARLVRHFNAIAGGDLDSELDGRFSGEVGVLRHHMQAMVGSLKDKIRESAELAEVSREEAERARRATGEADEARRQAEQARRQGNQHQKGRPRQHPEPDRLPHRRSHAPPPVRPVILGDEGGGVGRRLLQQGHRRPEEADRSQRRRHRLGRQLPQEHAVDGDLQRPETVGQDQRPGQTHQLAPAAGGQLLGFRRHGSLLSLRVARRTPEAAGRFTANARNRKER